MYSIGMDDQKIHRRRVFRDVVAEEPMMAESDSVPKGRDIAPHEEITIPFLDPVEWLCSVVLDKTVLTSDGRLEAVETTAGSRSVVYAARTGCTDCIIVLDGKDSILDLVEMSTELVQENRRL
jgi:hypothetical protein